MVKKNVFRGKNFLRAGAALAFLQAAVFYPRLLFAEAPYVEVPTDVSITGMLGKLRGYFFGAVIAVCVFMVIWGAFGLATSGGDESKINDAKNRILYASIGLIVAAMSMGIVSLIMWLAGVQ